MRKITHAFFAGFILACTLSSCTSLENIDLSTQEPLVKLDKGACFGQCPIYHATVYQNGVIAFQGERNTSKLGLWIRKLSDKEMAELKTQLAETKLWQYPPFYQSRIPDAPLIRLEQYEDGATKTVAGKEGLPDLVLELQYMMEKLAEKESSTWLNKKAINYNLPKGAVPGEIYVQLKPQVYVRNWVQGYARQRLKVTAELEDRSNYFLLNFDPTIAFPEEMERFFSFDDAVIYTSFLPEKE